MKNWTPRIMGIAGIAVAVCVPPASAQSPAEPSISQDEIAVYEAVLASWLGNDRARQLVNEQLSAPPSKHDPEFEECTRGLNFPVTAPSVQEEKSLAGVQFKRNGIELIDGSAWKPADPGQGIANGKSVDAAVKEGFSQSLISFSQIAFSRDGKDALVKFDMVCGSLCGSGSTIHLIKRAKGWSVASRCGNWIS